MKKSQQHLIQTISLLPIVLSASCYASSVLPAASTEPNQPSPDNIPITKVSQHQVRPDYEGLKRDTYYLFAYQFAVIGMLYVMPEGISGWDQEAKDNYSLSTWRENVRHAEWDKDDYVINYVLHPYWGAAYYVRGRERRLSRTQAFWYSTALSTFYEYGFEALFEKPSIQDLVVTPLAGIVVGDYFMQLRSDIAERQRLGKTTSKDRWLLLATDPLGAVNNHVDRFFGRQADFALRPYVRTRHFRLDDRHTPSQYSLDVNHEQTIGIELKLNF